MDNERKPLLSISLLASDRPDTLPRCLDSLKPIMEQLDCELIIVDTSKNSEIHELLLRYTNQVETFEWCNDFSAARNTGLKKASGEWFLFLDDDEWFVEYEDLIRFFKSGEYRSYGCANYIVRSFFDVNHEYYNETMVSRMIKLEKDTHFESKIHEYLYPVHGACKNLSAKVYHSGYIYETEEDRLKHFERNTSLLLQMMEEEPDNPRWNTQLAQEYRAVRKWEELRQHCITCLKESSKTSISKNSQANLQRMTFYAGYLLALMNLQEYDEVLQVCKELLADENCIELGIAMIYLSLAEVFYKQEQYEKTIQSGQKYLQIREQLEQNTELLMHQNTSLILNETLDKVKINKIYSIIICSELKLGNMEMLYQYYDKLLWNEPTIYVYEDTDVHILEALAKAEERKLLTRVLRDGMANHALSNRMINLFIEWEQAKPDYFRHIVVVFSQLESEHWYVFYLRAFYADMQADKKALQEALYSFYQKVPNIFIVPKHLYDMTENYDIELSEYWKETEADKWKANVKEYLSMTSQEHLEKFDEKIKNLFLPQDWHISFWNLSVIEREIIHGPREPWNLISYVEHMQTYVEEAFRFYGNYYREEIFLYYPELLPEGMQAAICMMEYLELEPKDKVAALGKLKDAVTMNPEFADGVGKFIKQYPELEKQREKKQREELRNLRDQVVGQVQSLLTQAKKMPKASNERSILLQQAMAIIGQLKQMVSDDLEVIALGLEIRLSMVSEL